MSWVEIKSAINSSIGTHSFDSLDKIIEKELYENYYNAISTYVDVWGDANGTIEIVPKGVEGIQSGPYNGKNYVRIILPNGIKNIGDNSFNNCGQLKRMIIPEGVESIGSQAFLHCGHLVDVTIPNSVKEIGNSAFQRCLDLKNITLPKGIVELNDNTFYDCSSLEIVRIPKSLKRIYNNVFANCSALSHVYYDGTESDWQDIVAGEGNSNLFHATIHMNY